LFICSLSFIFAELNSINSKHKQNSFLKPKEDKAHAICILMYTGYFLPAGNVCVFRECSEHCKIIHLSLLRINKKIIADRENYQLRNFWNSKSWKLPACKKYPVYSIRTVLFLMFSAKHNGKWSMKIIMVWNSTIHILNDKGQFLICQRAWNVTHSFSSKVHHPIIIKMGHEQLVTSPNQVQFYLVCLLFVW